MRTHSKLKQPPVSAKNHKARKYGSRIAAFSPLVATYAAGGKPALSGLSGILARGRTLRIPLLAESYTGTLRTGIIVRTSRISPFGLGGERKVKRLPFSPYLKPTKRKI